MKDLEIKTEITILRPAHDVFEAIAEPDRMSNYFISHGSGRLEEGKVVMWRFPEFDFEFPVRGGKIVKDKFISFFWDTDGKELTVEISLTPGKKGTLVTIVEKSMENNEAGIKWLQGNTAGWANFLACLKAYLEYGINLRKGAFDHLRKQDQQQ